MIVATPPPAATTRVLRGLAFPTYCELTPLNFSRLKAALQSPRHLWTAINDPEEDEESLDCTLGQELIFFKLLFF